jgi:hypothetical protein
MQCSGNFTTGNCTLKIDEVNFKKHEGNWTCMLQMSNSSWINSTNSVLIKVHSNVRDDVEVYGERTLRKLFSFVENMFNFFQVIENAIEEDDDDEDTMGPGGYIFK